METHGTVEGSHSQSANESKAQKPKESSRGKTQVTAFKLEDRSQQWGAKLWSLTFDLPNEKVNKLSKAVIVEMEALLPELEAMGKEGRIDALILQSGKAGNFIAGADIEMIQSCASEKEAQELSATGHRISNRWEDLPFPTIAAVNGSCLGGGCELALASSAIVMSDDSAAKIGLPEVMLGLIPGMGGCIRLPQKVGLATALDLILTGKALSGDRALRAGLVEATLPRQNFMDSVYRWAVTQLPALKAGKRIAKEPKLGGMGGIAGTVFEKTSVGRGMIFKKAREGVLSKTRGQYPAPLEALATLEKAGVCYGERLRGQARDRALALEAEGFGRMAVTEVSKNLVRLFFMTEGVKKSSGLPAGATAKAQEIRWAGVLGAGVMGGGIAQLLAEKDIPTRMKDLNTQALALGVQSASAIFQKQVKRKRINRRQYLQKMSLISPLLDFSAFGKLDLVVEAVVEKLEVKQKVFQELEGYVSDRCVIASNTSSLPISEMQKVMKRPERFVGMHFFNPVHKMPLVEVIRGEKTSDEAVTTIFQFCKKIGKTPVVVKDAPGFLVNRLLVAFLNEAIYLLIDGAPIDEIDQVLSDFGMPMGALELIDEVGVDVGDKVLHILHDAFGARMLPAPLTSKVLAAGRLGKKAGKGLYTYEGREKKKVLDPKIYEILGVTPQPGAISSEEIVERCILPMINEATRCLEEGIVSSASELDLGMIMGTGFPPFRGGLLRYADTLGAQTIVDRLRKYQERFGARFEPAPALIARAQHEQRFYPA